MALFRDQMIMLLLLRFLGKGMARFRIRTTSLVSPVFSREKKFSNMFCFVVHITNITTEYPDFYLYGKSIPCNNYSSHLKIILKNSYPLKLELFPWDVLLAKWLLNVGWVAWVGIQYPSLRQLSSLILYKLYWSC